MCLAEFLPTTNEKAVFSELQEQMHSYILLRHSVHQQAPDKVAPGLQDYLATIRPSHTHPSEIKYHSVLDAVADSKDTVMTVISDLYEQFVVQHNLTHLILKGDATLYEVLQSLKYEYEHDLEWLVPYPGDWHTLMNFQHALMKPYFDTGLKNLAQAAGYPPQQIKACSQFKHTHHFILEVWESMYRCMISVYKEQTHSQQHKAVDLQNKLVKMLSENKHQRLTHEVYSSSRTQQKAFTAFVQRMARTDETWKFWIGFVFNDAMAYVTFFLPMKSGDWDLRLYSLKQMAPIFTAYDHHTYQKVISNHLADVQNMPLSILAMFRQGAFVVSLSCRPWHSIGIDEAHKMKINKDLKTAIYMPN